LNEDPLLKDYYIFKFFQSYSNEEHESRKICDYIQQESDAVTDTLRISPIWKVEYNGNVIEVKNKATSCSLLINGQAVDTMKGMYAVGATLIGKTPAGETVKAVLNSGMFKIHCNIYVNDIKIFQNS